VPALTMQMTKACTRCGLVKERTSENFHRAARMADGLSSWCKECSKAYTRARVQASPEANRERSKAWYAKNPERGKARARAVRMADPERKKAQDAAWRQANADHKREMDRAWVARNLDRARFSKRVRQQRRRALQLAAEGFASMEQVQARIDYYGGLCYLCKAAWEQIDHVKPLSKGGSNWPANLRPICTSCNCAKGARWAP
jgi:5-methylcytosine-specific restriction endonuclease McrA